jgi:repressor LexA
MYFTKRQLEVLDFVRHYIAEFRVAPTLEEMADHFRVSKITIHDHLKTLEEKGVLRRIKNRARAIEIVDEALPEASRGSAESGRGEERLVLPVLGLVQAGSPHEPFENPDEFDVRGWLDRPGDFHLLRVQGESMIEDHIAEGDLVVVDRRKRPRNGDIVVAATPDGGVTLKRIFDEGHRVRLQPSNAAMEPMYFDSADVRGVVVGLMRQF